MLILNWKIDDGPGVRLIILIIDKKLTDIVYPICSRSGFNLYAHSIRAFVPIFIIDLNFFFLSSFLYDPSIHPIFLTKCMGGEKYN